ncbi:MAG: FxsA family protein [Spirochaetota bacterium]
MLDIHFMIRLFDKGFIIKLLFLLLLYSLLPLCEIFLILYLSTIFGKYLILALVAATGLIGVLAAYNQVRKLLDIIGRKIKEGYYPNNEFISFAGVLVGAVLLVTPGFITDFLGFVLFVPGARDAIGRLIISKMQGRLKEIYEYLKMSDN